MSALRSINNARTNSVQRSAIPSTSYTDDWYFNGVRDVLKSENLPERIKAVVEEAIIQQLVKANQPTPIIDDPFDSIYISELEPDFIKKTNIDKVLKCFSIQDLSNTITFNDGLDD